MRGRDQDHCGHTTISNLLAILGIGGLQDLHVHSVNDVSEPLLNHPLVLLDGWTVDSGVNN